MPNTMTPNDKLPEEILDQIIKEAADIYHSGVTSTWPGRGGNHLMRMYREGATAWAPWKVRYDELLESFMKLFKSNSELTSEYERLHKQAQRMADALEELVELKRMSDEEPLSLDYLKRKALAWEAARKALRQFKDGGKGKEPVKEIEYMPVHPEDARKPDCPKQFPMHLLNEDQAQSNHGQTLKRLKERGGLGVTEILAIVHRKKWSYFGQLQWDKALRMLNDILTNPTK